MKFWEIFVITRNLIFIYHEEGNKDSLDNEERFKSLETSENLNLWNTDFLSIIL